MGKAAVVHRRWLPGVLVVTVRISPCSLGLWYLQTCTPCQH